MYLWYPPYGTMQVRRGDLWYHYIYKKTWFRQPCKHNGSYRGNISFVVKKWYVQPKVIYGTMQGKARRAVVSRRLYHSFGNKLFE